MFFKGYVDMRIYDGWISEICGVYEICEERTPKAKSGGNLVNLLDFDP